MRNLPVIVLTMLSIPDVGPARSDIIAVPVVEPGSHLMVCVLPASSTSWFAGEVMASKPGVWETTTETRLSSNAQAFKSVVNIL